VTGAIQTWTVEINGDSYRTIHGQLDGKLQTTEWTVCIATNENRANQRTPQEQAAFEAQAMWKKKRDTGYHLDLDKIDTQLYIEPMLAKKWEDRKDKVKFPVYTQPKLDGLRAVITMTGAKSRNGKEWVTIPHILEALKPVFDQYPHLILDGELYNHDLKHDFNKITSLVKKMKPTDKDLDESAKVVQFHWYDTASNKHTFRQRKNWIKTLKQDFNLPDCIQVVSTHRVDDLDTLDKVYNAYLSKGYEGQMVRVDAPYEFKRSANLLKRKEFQDEEYKILDIVEGLGNKSSMAGYMVLDNGERGTFKSNIKGDREYLRELLENKNNYIGCDATVRYFNLTPDGVPRFPYIYGIRHGE
jgi:DNA ligase-1